MNKIVQTAREWLDTPYQHQQRLKGVAVDCVGLVIGVARELGIVRPEFDYTGYARVPHGNNMLQVLRANMRQIPRDQMRPGDVVCVSFGGDPQHVGIVGDYRHGGLSIIHAASNPGCVVETRLLFGKVFTFVEAYQFPEAAWPV